jgi:hypothetical protein
MRVILRAFLLLSGCGFLLSTVGHALALSGRMPPGKFVMELNVGVMAVWLPAVIVANRIAQANRGFSWKVILSGCPGWMRVILYFLIAYAAVNFALLFLSAGAPPNLAAAARVAAMLRFTGLDMMFYGAAFALLYSAARAPHLLTGAKCPNGHAVPPGATVCPDCGQSIAKKG